MGNTSIEWTDFSVNPLRFRNKETGRVGHYCEKISPGCKNCYASTMQKGPYLSGLEYIATNKDKGELYLEEKALQQVLRRRKPTKFFWCDMTDMFGEWVPDEWIDRCLAVMALTPQHTHQLLTKRAERMYEYFSAVGVRDRWADVLMDPRNWPNDWGDSRKAVLGNPSRAGLADGFRGRWREVAIHSVHLGVSVEDQQRADERIPWLLKTPAAVRFISAEPLLGPVDLDSEDMGGLHALGCGDSGCKTPGCRGIDWVIVGGESGPGARPLHPDWARSIRDQCVAAGVPFFFKQWGEWEPGSLGPRATYYSCAHNGVLMAGEHCQRIDEGNVRWVRVGKKAAGALIDGREWREYPEVAHA